MGSVFIHPSIHVMGVRWVAMAMAPCDGWDGGRGWDTCQEENHDESWYKWHHSMPFLNFAPVPWMNECSAMPSPLMDDVFLQSTDLPAPPLSFSSLAPCGRGPTPPPPPKPFLERPPPMANGILELPFVSLSPQLKVCGCYSSTFLIQKTKPKKGKTHSK